MTFRQPVVFTPFDVKVGYLYYGGKSYWSQLPYNSAGIDATDLPVLLEEHNDPTISGIKKNWREILNI